MAFRFQPAVGHRFRLLAERFGETAVASATAVTGCRYLVRCSLVVLALFVCAGCEPRNAPPDGPARDVAIWRPMGTWSGRGNTQTGSFSVESGALRLRWETRNESPPGAGRFRVSLHSAISGRLLQPMVDHVGVGSDTSYAEDEPRMSYLVIESENVDWTATLEEVVFASAGATPPR